MFLFKKWEFVFELDYTGNVLFLLAAHDNYLIQSLFSIKCTVIQNCDLCCRGSAIQTATYLGVLKLNIGLFKLTS